MEELIRRWRERIRGTERSRVVSDAVATFALGLLLLAVGLVGAWGLQSPFEVTDRWWLVLPLAAICAVMLGKAHRPLVALGAGVVIFGVDVVLGGSLGVMLALLDLIYSAALRASTAAVRRLGIGVTVCVAVGAAASFVATGQLQQSVYVGLLVFALLGTPLWWGRSVRQQTELAELASARAQDLARISELREQEVVHAERTRMAGDLHDALASHLSAIAIHSEAALATPGPAPTDAAADRDRHALSAIRASSVAALREMRSMIDLLRTGDETRTSPARLAEVDVLTASFRGQGMELVMSLPDALPPLPAAVDQAAYRILQESLANALQHGQGGPVEVTIVHEDGAVRVEVENAISRVPVAATVAGDTHGHSGVGLLTMQERAEALGGSFSAGPQQDRWRARALIPTEEAT